MRYVKEGPEEDPDHVDEVPVETGVLDGHVPLPPITTPHATDSDGHEHDHAGDHVERMQRSHEPVERRSHHDAAGRLARERVHSRAKGAAQPQGLAK